MTEQRPALYQQVLGLKHTALEMRQANAAILGEGVAALNSSALSLADVLADDLKVTQNLGTDMNVKVKRGGGWVTGDSVTAQGVYFVYNDADKVVAIAASDPTNPRIDILTARIDDTIYGAGDDNWDIAVVQGTPAASPTAPALPASSLLLAEVRVDATVTAIVDAKITDKRVPAAPTAGGKRHVFASVYTSANQSIPNAADTAMAWDNEENDDFAFHAPASNDRFIIPAGYDGVYVVSASLEFANNTTGVRAVKIFKNGALVAQVTIPASPGTQGNHVPCRTRPLKCVATDYFQVMAYQNSGGALNAITNLATTWFAIERKGRS